MNTKSEEDSKAYRINECIQNGINHYLKFEDEIEAISLMKIGFSDQCTFEGEPNPIDSKKYILLMSKILDQLLFISY